jgi:hypothetical protein
VTAAIIIGRTAGAHRFPTDGHFARHAGTAPIPASSGKTQRHRLHRGGDRQLNRAIHIIAISRAKTDPETRAYLLRKQAEGKTKLEAIRCLKRHLARRIWRLLYTAETTRPSVPINLANTDFHLTYRYENSGREALGVFGPAAWLASGSRRPGALWENADRAGRDLLLGLRAR